ncbi:beta-galactosidase [Paenibacillus glycinis]|uniref:beta-galactosidase n=1 Tax=Paenibacillus glycinis TaxID=2697035 RepID=UPI001F3474CA|nr:beta-galactosidase [Paenibacillus glycinis]
MNMETKHGPTLQLNASSLRIGGRAEIILCASLFYFRIPRALWRERLDQVKAFGYNAIDVYFPWNHHELEEGRWDFAGERDAEAFLQLAAEAGLWVVARPGPYICSEWDGGGLPAYLFAKPDMIIRSADPRYMEAVEKWYSRILPLLARYELNRGGTVICVQLENELDFYDCPDPAAYVAGLRDMAHGSGIGVPLIACAGQGGLYEASGFAEGVVPTCNFYPNDRDPAFEHKVAAYEARLAASNLPLLVTETNRSHFLLRRLLSCGAKLLGPYLQASGTNFGFTNGTNNWGDPLAFMTSDYDFRGMISPEGHVRQEAYEGRLLRRVIRAYGDALAEAATAPASGIARLARGPEAEAPATDIARLAPGPEAEAPVTAPASTGLDSRVEADAPVTEGLAQSAEPTAPTAESSGLARSDSGPKEGGSHLERQLRLAGGGHLLFLANVGDEAESVSLILAQGGGETVVPQTSRLRSIPGRCAILPVAVPLGLWGVGGTLRYATAELSDVRRSEGRTAMVFHAAEREGEIALALAPGAAVGEAANMSAQATEDGFVFVFRAEAGQIASCRIALADGQRLELFGLAREDALLLGSIGEDGSLAFEAPLAYDAEPRELNVSWTSAVLDPTRPMSAEPALPAAEATFLERNGIYRGFAWYEANVGAPAGIPVHGLLVRQGSDVVSLYADSAYIGTCTPGGGSRYMPAEGIGGSRRLAARAEIWGHTNFDDPRLPGLRLNSMKGLTGLTAVTGKQRLTSNWRVRRVHARAIQPELLGPDCDDAAWPVVGFGGWLSPDHPAFEYYRRRFAASRTADSFTLHFQGIQALAEVYVNGRSAGAVHPFDPYVDITAHVRPGEETLVTVFLERVLGLPAGEVTLYEGNVSRDWRLSACDEAGLLEHAQRRKAGAAAAELPISLAAGGVAWLYGALPDEARGMAGGWRVQAAGAGMKLTVLLGGTVVGRLWTDGGANASRPVLSGGDPRSFYLPGPWLREAARDLAILLEAVEAGAISRLDRLIFAPAGEPAKQNSGEG